MKIHHYNTLYSRMKENDERNLYLTEKLRNAAYNTKYNLLSFFEEYGKDSFAKPKDQIFILGRKFVVQEGNLVRMQEEIYEIFMATPWLTYRAGFPELPNQVEGSYVSDTGWGCMVRVGQMMFAQVIKHHRKVTSRTDILNILSLFSDFDRDQPFSIHRIARLARIEYGLKPGDWYNPSQIAFILGQLNEQALADTLRLKFVVFNSGNLFYDTLGEAMLGRKMQCSCQDKIEQFMCSTCNKVQYAVAVIVLSRLGLNGPEKKYLTILEKLMELEFCQGVIGGKPEKALYFIGKQNDQFIYLDPHYVHTANKDIKSEQQTYFCESFRKCKNTAIDSSIGICFYLRGIAEFNRFHKEIEILKTSNYEDFFIFVADKTPSYIKSTAIKSIQINAKDDVFEIL